VRENGVRVGERFRMFVLSAKMKVHNEHAKMRVSQDCNSSSWNAAAAENAAIMAGVTESDK
jgi:hypothetical protein